MQIRDHHPVVGCPGAVICYAHNGNADLLFNAFEQGFTDHRGTAEHWIDMDKQTDPRVMVQLLAVIVTLLADILLYRGMGPVNIPVEFFVQPDGLFLQF
jgi:hypothetical protein